MHLMFPQSVPLVLVIALYMLRVESLDDPLVEYNDLQIRQQISAVPVPSKFLRRGYHASAVAENFVYIDGGQFSFTGDDGNTNYEALNDTLVIDLSKDWTNDSVALNVIKKTDGTPTLKNPSLWYHKSEGVLYAGFTGMSASFNNSAPPLPPPESIWTLKPDNQGGGSWAAVDSLDSSAAVWDSIKRPNLPFMAYSSDEAYVLNGRDINTTENVQGRDVTGASGPYLPGMIRFDMKSRSFSNISGFGLVANQGSMQYVPPFGPGGIFISMGGFQPSPGVDLVDFGAVSVFDPATQEWFNQTTSGSKPTPRAQFCTAGYSSTQTTYEIFVYGGNGPSFGSAAIPYDTVNILSIPAFHWTSVNYQASNPRWGHTCHAVGGGQILIIGGTTPNTKIQPDPVLADPDVYQSMFNSSPDPFQQGLGIFDMSSLTFANKFRSGLPSVYNRSAQVNSVYDGGAAQSTLVRGVAALVKTTNFNTTDPSKSNGTSSTASLTPSSSKSGSHAGAIAGGVVGGVVGVALIAALAFFLLRRRRAGNRPTEYLPGNPDIPSEKKESPYDQKPNPEGLHELRAKEAVSEMPGNGTQPGELSAERQPLSPAELHP